MAGGIGLRRGGPQDQGAPAGDLAVGDRLERRLGQRGRELHRQRVAGDDHARQRSGGRRMPLIERQGVQLVGARAARLDQHIGALSGGNQQLVHLLHGAQLDAVEGNDVQPVLVELQKHVVLVLRGDEAPALHLPRPHVDGRPPLAVDRQEARRGFRKQRAEILDHMVGVEHDLRQQHDALARLGDLRHLGKVAFDDDGARHVARHLHIGRAMVMRMIPAGAARVVLRQRDLDVVAVSRLHRTHDVVGDAARAAVRAVKMEIRAVELVRIRGEAGLDVAVGRHVVGKPDLQRLARLHAQVEAKAADVAIGVGAAQLGAEHPVGRAADFRLDQRLVHGRRSRRVRQAGIGHVVVVRAVGLPQRSASTESQSADRQAGPQQATTRRMRPEPAARAEPR